VQNALLHGDHCQGSSSRHGDREVIVLQFCGIALSLACALRAVTRDEDRQFSPLASQVISLPQFRLQSGNLATLAFVRYAFTLALGALVLNQTLQRVAMISGKDAIVHAGPSSHGALTLRRHECLCAKYGCSAWHSEGRASLPVYRNCMYISSRLRRDDCVYSVSQFRFTAHQQLQQ